MPVRVGNPANISGLIDDVENPSFATAVGLLAFARNFRGGSESAGFSGILKPFSGNLGGGIFAQIQKLLKSFLPK